jgi:P-type E1-E2 ATPase
MAATTYYNELPRMFKWLCLARGLLIRGGDILEAASHVDTLLFDKTGTLTRGQPTVVAIRPSLPSLSEETVLAKAAALERHTTHPIARAISSAADQQGIHTAFS